MPPKVTLIIATVSRSANVQDINMEDISTSNNINSAWFKNILQQFNQNIFKVKLNAHNH